MITIAGLLVVISLYSQVGPEQLSGTWLGKLNLPSTELRIVFHIKSDEAISSGLSATMDSPDQGAKGIPVSAVNLDGQAVELTVAAVGGKFVGEYKEGALEGEWHQGAGKLALRMNKIDPAELEPKNSRKPQEPIRPFPYNEDFITFRNDQANITLAGTLTYPRSDGPFTTVILISGSGPQNRDEELLGHKPFLVLSHHLTKQGFAVLRFDERGVGESTGNFATATTRDFASDVGAAVDYLRNQNLIEIAKLGLAGHSEGGLVAPMVANDREDIDFLILMAAPGLPGTNILQMQTGLIAKANGATEAQVKEALKRQGQLLNLITSESDLEKLQSKVDTWIAETLAGFTEEEKKQPQNSEANLRAGAKALMTPWFRYFLKHDPFYELAEIRDTPVLAINGELDLQVPAKENLDAIKQGLDEAGNWSLESKIFPGLNHLFQTAKTGSPNEYANIDETMALAVMEYIANWIKKR